MKTNKIFHNQHIKIELRLPTPKHLDMNDACDALEALGTLRKEWVATSCEVLDFLLMEEEVCHKALSKGME